MVSTVGEIVNYTARLAELGIELPPVPAPLAAYVPAARSGQLVFSSGQVPSADGVLAHTGKVGVGPGLVDPDDAAADARICVINALAAVAAVAGSLDNIRRVVKVTGFVASAPDFTGQPAVINGASTLLKELFGAAGDHARSAVGVVALPMNAPVEVEIIVEVA